MFGAIVETGSKFSMVEKIFTETSKIGFFTKLLLFGALREIFQFRMSCNTVSNLFHLVEIA